MKPTQLKTYSSIVRGNRGVAFLEFVLVFPVLFLIFLAFVDFGRYAYIKNLIDASANRALLLATAIEGLDDEPSIEGSRYDESKSRVESLAKQLALSAFLTDSTVDSKAKLSSQPWLELPAPGGGQTLKQALQNAPMRMHVEAEITPFLPFLPVLRINGLAVGYREPSSEISLPVPTDCVGNPSGSYSFYKTCPCEGSNEHWNSSTRECIPCGDVGTASSTWCNCSNAKCQEGLGPHSFAYRRADGSCGCQCSSQFTVDDSGQCNCSGGRVGEGSGTASRCVCTGEQEWKTAACRAKFPGLPVQQTGDRCGCTCSNSCGSNMIRSSPANGCTCSCNGEKYEPNADGTACECKDRNMPCDNPRHRRSSSNCLCYCPLSCTHGTLLDSCQCECYDGSVVNGDSCSEPPSDEPEIPDWLDGVSRE